MFFFACWPPQFWHIHSCRTRVESIFKHGLFSNTLTIYGAPPPVRRGADAKQRARGRRSVTQCFQLLPLCLLSLILCRRGHRARNRRGGDIHLGVPQPERLPDDAAARVVLAAALCVRCAAVVPAAARSSRLGFSSCFAGEAAVVPSHIQRLRKYPGGASRAIADFEHDARLETPCRPAIRHAHVAQGFSSRHTTRR